MTRGAAAALSFALIVAGCAPLVEADCGRDWYALGKHSGRLGATRPGELYAAACSSFDTARFQQGWAEGYSHRLASLR
jgi:hypothetical protein